MAFTHAAVCRLGHVVLRDVDDEPVPTSCPRDGVPVFTRCLRCETRLRGPEYELRRSAFAPLLTRAWKEPEWVPPPACHRCRQSHPWARITRQLRARQAREQARRAEAEARVAG